MKIVLSGKYESAIVRMIDADFSPNRNVTANQYYLDLNRDTEKRFIDGAGTFIAIADETYVPWELDWNFPYAGGNELSILRTPRLKGDDASEDQLKQFDSLRDQIIKKNVLSSVSRNYITSLDLSNYPSEVAESYLRSRGNQRIIMEAYLRRLMHQLYSSKTLGAFLIIGEADIGIISEIADALMAGQITTPLPFPDLRGKLIDPNLFSNGILNFSPIDLRSIVAVRNDSQIRRYTETVRNELAKHPMDIQNDTLNEALIESYRRSEAGRRVKKLFQIASWIVKPLHYIPIAGEILTAAEGH